MSYLFAGSVAAFVIKSSYKLNSKHSRGDISKPASLVDLVLHDHSAHPVMTLSADYAEVRNI